MEFKMKSEYTNYGRLMNRIKEMEIELKEQRLAAKFDREDKKLCNFLVDNIPDIIFRLNAFGKIEFVNNAVKTYGYERETLIGRDILEFVHPDNVDKVKQQIKERRTGDCSTKNLEVRLITGEKMVSERIFSVASKGVYSSEKPRKETFLGTLGIARDITQQKKLELQAHHDQKMEALGTLARGIAHDFNNILNLIIGYTSISLANTNEKSNISHWLGKILQACERAKELVNQIVTFSRQKEQEKKPVKLNLIVNEVLKLIRPFIKSGIEFRQNIQKGPAMVKCDPCQFHQVVMNLCTNAAQAMEETGGLLEISLANIDVDENSANRCLDLKPGSYVRLSVSDTGKGMDKKTMERIFEPYFTTKPHGKGTGLGLSVVHGIVKSMEGAIKVYSEPGKGTTFQLFFPRIEIETRQDLKTKKSIPRGTEHILLVDDENVVLELAEEILEDLGYTVTTRISGTEALKTFRENPGTFDLLITDLTMPGMNGKELAAQVLEIRPGFPVILCTGFSTEMAKEDESPKVIQTYINKPILIQEIAETVREVLDKEKKISL
jgi:PAS domain S-box-containing protein